jgi:gliding motility-associated protein GldE
MFVLLAGVLSATESALFSLKQPEIDNVSDTRKRKLISKLLGNPRLLVTVLTTWKYAMLISAAVLFTIAIRVPNELGFLPFTLVLTIVFVFFSVIAPKIYGTSINVSIATSVVGICNRLVKISSPVVNPLLKMSYKVERKLEAIAEENSVKELTQALQLAAVDKQATEDEREILQGIVNFGTLTVKDVMRPRNEINCVDRSLNFHDLLIYIKKSGFSRIPAYDHTEDHIKGVLYIKDLLPFINESKTFNWQRFLRPAYFVSESKKIDLLLKDFQEKRVHMAIVINDEGTTAGIITLEDLIEEIVGEIHDEFDEVGAYYKKVDEKTFVVDSKIPVHELCRILDVDTSAFDQVKSETETLGAVLLEMQNELPRIGDQIVLDPFTLVIEAIDHKRIKKIRVHIHESKES